MDSKQHIFVGFELTEAVSEQFVDCDSRDRVYLDDPTFLETIVIDGRKYIGKRVNDAIATDRLEDVARSVTSLMSRVSKSWNTSSSDALIFAVEESEPTGTEVLSEEESEQSKSFDYSGLVD
ncbi:MAG: hypothetical protein GY854_12330 [Deltaproteobacteria bacterium]|nr:hypothetical protein [Deltaproteobacteria bacterium]